MLDSKLTTLRSILRDCGSLLVAYSGGVDSALVLAVAHQELPGRALACIGVSPSYPRRELDHALDFLCQIGASHRLIDTEEYVDPNYAANPVNRCYYCKSHLYARLKRLAEQEKYNAIADGSHLSDLADHGHGLTAARQHGVRSPLIEAGFAKSDVRQAAQQLGLKVWDKPAMACLASRVPTGTPISPQLLSQIESAENALVALGFRQFRVRHHGQLARIEIPADDFPRAFEHHAELVRAIQHAGYRHVTLDLAGFRRESL